MEVLLEDTRGQRQFKSLLLVFLFVWNTAADCLIPEGGPNMVPTTETLLRNDFPEGSEAVLECANGYVEDSGSGILTCRGGKWTEPDLTCIKKDCGVPEEQKNMKFHIFHGTLYGDMIKVTCDEGYRINGTSYRQCIATGWFGSGQCDIVTCNKPLQVANGRSSWISEKNPEYKQFVNYSCADGYTLRGNASITCSKTGQYDSPPPECQGVTTEDRVTTKMVTSAPPSSEPETLPARTSSITTTTHRATTFTARTSAAVSASEREGEYEAVNPSKNTALILAVTFVSLVAVLGVVLFFLCKCQQKRKGFAVGAAPA
ncbi:complement decay-accelerating factor isoform X2 [Austrofundulus limnaeus]|uniref:Complement decay-accelerating factor isoform X2 n=1 Tax=Austrofundulus limnaeus TaxID=52670 RepID=A0A2I4BB83_AUSLI|nr:PREDICTED: complement decay-accelerating factor isoform X2 [Austrofundulus limnaeus]